MSVMDIQLVIDGQQFNVGEIRKDGGDVFADLYTKVFEEYLEDAFARKDLSDAELRFLRVGRPS